MSLRSILLFAAVGALSGWPPHSGAFAQGSIDSAISGNISRNVARGIDRALAAHIVRPTLQIRNDSGEVSHLDLSSQGSTLTLVLEDGTVRVWDIALGIQRPRISPKKIPIVAVGDRTGGNVAVGLAGGEVQIYRTVSRDLVKTSREHDGPVTALSFSSDGRLLASGGVDGFVNLWRADTFSREARLPLAKARVTALAFSSRHRVLFGGDDRGRLRRWDLSGPRPASVDLRLKSAILAIRYLPESDELVVVTAREARVVDGGTLAEKRSMDFEGRATAAAVDSAGRLVSYAGESDGEIRILDTASGRETQRLPGIDRRISSLVLDSRLGRLVSASSGGKVRIWDIDLGEDLLRLVSTRRGWAVIDRQGRFDGSEQGLNDVVWNARGEELSLERFAERFFEPGLLTEIVEERVFRPAEVPGAISEGITLPPLVEIDPPEQKGRANEPMVLIVIATDRGGGIDELRLYHNGKLVQPGSLLQQQNVEGGEKRIRAAAFRVLPTPGLNTFVAVANERWGIEGRSSRLTMDFAGKRSPPTLHVVTLALNRYKDARLNLNYSVPDAEGILESLGLDEIHQFSEVKRYVLHNEEVTQPNVINLLKNLRETRKDDVVVLYLAGHGIVIEDDWYFLTHESRLQDDVSNYKRFSLSATEIQDLLVGANAQRILVMIDACYSGTGVQTFERFQNFQRRYIRRFSRAAGVTVLAATRQNQLAIELAKLGHGLFTYVVLDGLQGKADISPRDGIVSAHELVSYSASAIPEYAREYLNIRQVPMAFALGADFGLVANN